MAGASLAILDLVEPYEWQPNTVKQQEKRSLFFKKIILSFLHLFTCVYIICSPPPLNFWAKPVLPSSSPTLLKRKHKR
jgi:hypothetical protein